MRRIAVLVAASVLAACSPARAPVPEPLAPLDSVVDFLLTSAAKDFHDHRPPDPVRFRDVRIGHLVGPGGKESYRLCGEFLPAQEAGNAEWTHFATIKTSGYEQWLGGQSSEFCPGAIVWDKTEDLSSELQRRVDSLR